MVDPTKPQEDKYEHFAGLRVTLEPGEIIKIGQDVEILITKSKNNLKSGGRYFNVRIKAPREIGLTFRKHGTQNAYSK